MLEVWTSDETEARLSGWLGLGVWSAAVLRPYKRTESPYGARPATKEDRLRRVPALQELVYLLE